MKEYKLYNTDGKTFFDFRSNPNSRCEAFTLTFCDDGTVVMSGDYGTLCWKREYNGRKDYGFPDKQTDIGYFASKVCQHGIQQKITKWDKNRAVEDLKEIAKSSEFEDDKKFKELLEEVESVEDDEEMEFRRRLHKFDEWDLWECDVGNDYTPQFKFMLEALQSVSEQILTAVSNNKESDTK